MNTEGTEYGTVFKNRNGWQAEGRNPIEQKKTYIGFFHTEDEAKFALNKWNFDFFSKHTWLLPRNIAINRRDKNFIFIITIRGKPIRVGAYSSVDEAVQAKVDFITKMI